MVILCSWQLYSVNYKLFLVYFLSWIYICDQVAAGVELQVDGVNCPSKVRLALRLGARTFRSMADLATEQVWFHSRQPGAAHLWRLIATERLQRPVFGTSGLHPSLGASHAAAAADGESHVPGRRGQQSHLLALRRSFDSH